MVKPITAPMVASTMPTRETDRDTDRLGGRDTDIAIAGGGIAGAALAVALRDRGYLVDVIEPRKGTLDTARGDHLQPCNVALFSQWGIFDELVARGAGRRVGHEFRTPDGTALLHAEYSEMTDLPVPHFLVIDHDQIAEWLLDIADRSDAVTIHRPASVVGATSSDGRLTSLHVEPIDGDPFELRAHVIVGADGTNSIVRNTAGIASTEHRYEHPMVAMFGPCPPELGRTDYFYRYGGPAGQLVIQPRMGGTIKVTTPVGDEGISWWRASTVEQRSERLGSIAHALRTYESTVAGFYPARRVDAEVYATGNVVVVGDAAHAMHPARGQGLNLGISCLETLLRHLPPPNRIGDPLAVRAALASYDAELRPRYAKILAANHQAALAMEASANGFGEDGHIAEAGFLRAMNVDPVLRRNHLLDATGYPDGIRQVTNDR
jgi:2-polyprenyl-6-methoxyphenol hydroxylase-like FAD-dependent oxidoreductase